MIQTAVVVTSTNNTEPIETTTVPAEQNPPPTQQEADTNTNNSNNTNNNNNNDAPPQLPKPQQTAEVTANTDTNVTNLKREREDSGKAESPPSKKIKLANHNTINPNSDAFDENPYTNNNGKVLSRTQSDLKRYLNSMDEDALKNDLLPKLCESHKSLLDSIRSRMSENTILCKIFIRSLSYDTQDKTVHDMFDKFGNVKEAVIVKDRQTGKSRGFGFITMSNASEAQSALVEHRKLIDGREAICNLASKPQGQKTSTNNKKRDDNSSSFHSHRNNDHSSRSKRDNNPSPTITNNNQYNAAVAQAPAYAYAHSTPYTYDYNYQYPHNTNVAAPPAINPYNAMNPYATNPYAQYNRTQTNSANTNTTTQNTTNAASAAAISANTNLANQPYVPSMAAFGAAPYRFN